MRIKRLLVGLAIHQRLVTDLLFNRGLLLILLLQHGVLVVPVVAGLLSLRVLVILKLFLDFRIVILLYLILLLIYIIGGSVHTHFCLNFCLPLAVYLREDFVSGGAEHLLVIGCVDAILLLVGIFDEVLLIVVARTEIVWSHVARNLALEICVVGPLLFLADLLITRLHQHVSLHLFLSGPVMIIHGCRFLVTLNN